MSRVCSYIARNGRSCPNLAEPGTGRCADHPGRPRNASWSAGRNTTRQGRERRAALRAANYTCRRCGKRDISGRSLDLHHETPTRGVVLCNDCHVEVDPNARRR